MSQPRQCEAVMTDPGTGCEVRCTEARWHGQYCAVHDKQRRTGKPFAPRQRSWVPWFKLSATEADDALERLSSRLWFPGEAEAGLDALLGRPHRIKRKATPSGGYLLLRSAGRVELAHRYIWRLHFGSVPFIVGHHCHDLAAHAGLCDGGHTCPHRACTEITHLTAHASSGANVLASPLSVSSKSAQRTACSVCGGPFYYLKNGWRSCRECEYRRGVEGRARRRLAKDRAAS